MNPIKKIVWLASYPKSGNTWFRAFLSALMNDEGQVDINSLETDGIFSSRHFLSDETDIDSTLLNDNEVKILLPEVFNSISRHYQKEQLYIKVHDAYVYNDEGRPIIPSESTFCAIYIIRNPLDIVASLANHNSVSIDKSIDLMNDAKGCFASQNENFNVNNQTKQLLFDWSGHVNSWLSISDFPVYFVRYEDLKSEPFKYFSETIQKTGLNFSTEKIKKAIKASSFEELRKQEKLAGFQEKAFKSEMFFRKGEAGNWRKELTEEQISSILSHHKNTMQLFNY